jgi:TPP-dependent trihydroxycyclohexane-1,2-dione (THcHDO) dehydratase
VPRTHQFLVTLTVHTNKINPTTTPANYIGNVNDEPGLPDRHPERRSTPVDLALNAESLGADVIRVKTIDEFRSTLDQARAATRLTDVHIETDMLAPVPSSESWWDVPVSEVAQLGSTQQARKVYESHKAEQRAFLTPITEEIAK